MRIAGWAFAVICILILGFTLYLNQPKMILFVWAGIVLLLFGIIRMTLDFLASQAIKKQHSHHGVPHPPPGRVQGAFHPSHRPQMQQHQQQHPAASFQPHAFNQHAPQPDMRSQMNQVPMLCACGNAYLRPTDVFCPACGRRVR